MTGWAVCLKNLESDKWQMIPCGEHVDHDDPRYGDEIHVMPCFDDPQVENHLNFGFHDFSRECVCHPKLQPQASGKVMIIHNERVN